MLKSISLFGTKKNKTTRPFKEYYGEWVEALRATHLPLLRRHATSAASSTHLLSAQVEAFHRHFQSYYHALDSAAQYDVAQLLFPDWRGPLEKPFLFLGDLHPYLFTSFLRSLIQRQGGGEEGRWDYAPPELVRWPIVVAGERQSSRKLATRIDQIECGLRLMVPALADRLRKAQSRFIRRVGSERGGRRRDLIPDAVAAAEMEEEVVGVFTDANRLRRSVIAEIVGALSVYHAALFLEGLSQFLVGIRDDDVVKKFENCKLVAD